MTTMRLSDGVCLAILIAKCEDMKTTALLSGIHPILFQSGDLSRLRPKKAENDANR